LGKTRGRSEVILFSCSTTVYENRKETYAKTGKSYLHQSAEILTTERDISTRFRSLFFFHESTP
jgi:hypothetical protein